MKAMKFKRFCLSCQVGEVGAAEPALCASAKSTRLLLPGKSEVILLVYNDTSETDTPDCDEHEQGVFRHSLFAESSQRFCYKDVRALFNF